MVANRSEHLNTDFIYLNKQLWFYLTNNNDNKYDALTSNENMFY